MDRGSRNVQKALKIANQDDNFKPVPIAGENEDTLRNKGEVHESLETYLLGSCIMLNSLLHKPDRC